MYQRFYFFITGLVGLMTAVAWSQTDPEFTVATISYLQAFVLGLVEGFTEYLPVSSTGHLIIVDELLGLRDTTKLTTEQLDAVEAFEIVIQSGAIIAVLYVYMARVKKMILGLMGRPEFKAERQLAFNIVGAFIPTMTIGFVLHKVVKHYLQSLWPTVAALAIGGIFMILFERSKLAKDRRTSGFGLSALTLKSAILIGLMQCIAMWPGTSRSMMTIVGGILVGLHPVAAAEFSFLLGLPTLLAATVFKLWKDGDVLVAHIGYEAMGIGLVTAAITAFLTVKALLQWLTKYGLAVFGWYRLGLAAVLLLLQSRL
jgi:undecaprenyl-diphosphatase